MKKLHALMQAVVAFVAAITVALPAQALPPSVQAVVMNTGQIRKVDAYWPRSQTDSSGCWTVQVENPHTLAPITRPEKVRLLRPGFTTSATPTVYVEELTRTQRVRNFWPNNGALTDRDALSDFVYASDRIPGVINGCLLESPKPVALWRMQARSVVGNSLAWEIVAGHRNARNGLQVPAIVVRASDSDGGGDCATQTVNTTHVSARSTDRHSLVVYGDTLDLSACADGLITLNAKVYPWIGTAASVLDSADQSGGREFSPRHFAKYTTGYSKPYAYVTSGGSDANDCADTDPDVADNNPCATVQGAINRLHTDFGGGTWGIDGAEIRVGDTAGLDLDSTSGNKTQKIACITVTRSPVSTSRAAVVLASGDDQAVMNLGTSGSSLTSPLTTGCMRFHDITLQRSGVHGIVTGGGSVNLDVQLDDVTWDRGTQTNTALQNTHFWISGLTCSTAGNQGFGVSTGEVRMASGLNCDFNGSSMDPWFVVASDLDRIGSSGLAPGTTRSHSGLIFASNELCCFTSTTGLLIGSQFGAPTGVFIANNVFEWTTTSAGHPFAVSNDNAPYGNDHVIIHNNTFAGFYGNGRVNLFYDEDATPRRSRNPSVVGNVFVQSNTKSDVFRGGTNQGGVGATDASPRVGNWSYEYGAGVQGNIALFIDANNGGVGGSFAPDYDGLRSVTGTSSTVASPAYSAFTSWQATTNTGSTAVAGTGGGDYRLKAGNAALGVVTSAVLSHTMNGVARPAANDNAGALSQE